jgi:hypothetical protein
VERAFGVEDTAHGCGPPPHDVTKDVQSSTFFSLTGGRDGTAGW